MSRAINVNATEAEVLKTCASNGVTISVIGSLASGGTWVVLTNATSMQVMWTAFGRKVLTGNLRRTPLRTIAGEHWRYAGHDRDRRIPQPLQGRARPARASRR